MQLHHLQDVENLMEMIKAETDSGSIPGVA